MDNAPFTDAELAYPASQRLGRLATVAPDGAPQNNPDRVSPGRLMPTSVSVLDEALDRVSALEFEGPNPFVSHAPMACEALAALGFEAVIDEWVCAFEASMGRAVEPATPQWHGDLGWKGRLGDGRLLPEWMGYFERVIADEGWPTVVEVWVPRLMPGFVAALFHGVIRTSHAVRAIDAADTPARRAELARALGNWATWYHTGRPVDEIPEVDDALPAAAEAAAAGARCYVTAPNIFNLHGVTGATAVHLLAGHISPADGAAAVMQLRAEHRSLYRGTQPTNVDDGAKWDDDAGIAASQSHDPHQIKLVEACRRGFDLTGDSGFVLAADTVTGIRRG